MVASHTPGPPGTERNVCPSCGSRPADVVTVVAPKDDHEVSNDAFVRGLVGAFVGGALGVVRGPTSVALGVSLGGAIGGASALLTGDGHAVVECADCGRQRIPLDAPRE